jgi:glucoamylase
VSNLKVYVDSFRSVYLINAGIDVTSPVAVGRCPEDVDYTGDVFSPLFAPGIESADALL